MAWKRPVSTVIPLALWMLLPDPNLEQGPFLADNCLERLNI